VSSTLCAWFRGVGVTAALEMTTDDGRQRRPCSARDDQVVVASQIPVVMLERVSKKEDGAR